MIKVSNLSKRYENITALKNISFSVEKGEVIGFLGPNGAGKSTTMKILTSFIPPSAGKVTIGGYDVFSESQKTRQLIGYLPENNPLYPEMTVRSFLSYMGSLKKVPKNQRKKEIAQIISQCGLEQVQDRIISKLSKGYKQRVGLGGALVGNPEVLILDEPTIGLDPNQIIEIRNLIKELGKEKTIILSTHILPEVSVTCSRVIIINQGQIVATDTPNNLTAKLSGHASINLVIRGPEENIINSLKNISDIKNIEKIRSVSSDVVELKIKTRGSKDIREEISKYVVSNNWGLLEIKKDILNLEQIFQKLTLKEEK